jgi:hypothetical protein
LTHATISEARATSASRAGEVRTNSIVHVVPDQQRTMSRKKGRAMSRSIRDDIDF